MLSVEALPAQLPDIAFSRVQEQGLGQESSARTPVAVNPILLVSKKTAGPEPVVGPPLPAPPRTSRDQQRGRAEDSAPLRRAPSSGGSQDRGKQAVREWSEWVDACANSPGATPKSTKKVKLEPDVSIADGDSSSSSELDSADELVDPVAPPKPNIKGPRKHAAAISNSAFDRFDAGTVYAFLNGATESTTSVNTLLPLKARITTDEIRLVVIELIHSLALFVHSFHLHNGSSDRAAESRSWALLALRKGDQIESIGEGHPLSDLAMPSVDLETAMTEGEVRYQRQEIDALLQELEDLIAQPGFIAGLLQKGNFATLASGQVRPGPDGRYPYETSPAERTKAHQEALDLLLCLEEVLWGKNYPSGDLSELKLPSERSRSSAQQSQGLLDILADGPELDVDLSRNGGSSAPISEMEVDFVTSALSMTHA